MINEQASTIGWCNTTTTTWPWQFLNVPHYSDNTRAKSQSLTCQVIVPDGYHLLAKVVIFLIITYIPPMTPAKVLPRSMSVLPRHVAAIAPREVWTTRLIKFARISRMPYRSPLDLAPSSTISHPNRFRVLLRMVISQPLLARWWSCNES